MHLISSIRSSIESTYTAFNEKIFRHLTPLQKRISLVAFTIFGCFVTYLVYRCCWRLKEKAFAVGNKVDNNKEVDNTKVKVIEKTQDQVIINLIQEKKDLKEEGVKEVELLAPIPYLTKEELEKDEAAKQAKEAEEVTQKAKEAKEAAQQAKEAEEAAQKAKVQSAYEQVNEVLSSYNNFTVKQYSSYINKYLQYFSKIERCPNLNKAIPPKFLKVVEQLEQKIEKSTWDYLPAVKKQHDKFVEFANFYKGLRNLENISLNDAQKQSTCQITIKVEITTDRNLGINMKKEAFIAYNKSFGYWKAGHHDQLKCTFEFVEKFDDQAIKNHPTDLLIAPIWDNGGRLEMASLNRDIAPYLQPNIDKLKGDGFAIILIMRSLHNSLKEHTLTRDFPQSLEGCVADRTIFMSCVIDKNNPCWLNDTSFKSKIKEILIKKACIEKAKFLLTNQ